MTKKIESESGFSSPGRSAPRGVSVESPCRYLFNTIPKESTPRADLVGRIQIADLSFVGTGLLDGASKADLVADMILQPNGEVSENDSDLDEFYDAYDWDDPFSEEKHFGRKQLSGSIPLRQVGQNSPLEEAEFQERDRKRLKKLKEPSVSRQSEKVGKRAQADFNGIMRLQPKEKTSVEEKTGPDVPFNKEAYLSGTGASVWICSKHFGSRVGQEVALKKEVSIKVADKEGQRKIKTTLETDGERQEKVDEAFARLKCAFGLTKDNIVRYSICGHFIEIYEKNTLILEAKYDLLDPEGVRQLVRDRKGVQLSDEELEHFIKQTLEPLREQFRVLTRREAGAVPQNFITEIFESSLPLYKSRSKQQDFFMETAKTLGLVNKGQTVLNERGVLAFVFINRVLTLQKMLLLRVDRKQEDLQRELDSVGTTARRQEALNKEKIFKQKMALERFKEVIRNMRHLEDLHFMLMAFSSEMDLVAIDGIGFSIDETRNVSDLAQKVSSRFKEISCHQERIKRRRRWLPFLKKVGDVEADPSSPAHQKIQAVASRLGTLIFDLFEEKPLTRLKKIEFLESQKEPLVLDGRNSEVLNFLLKTVMMKEGARDDLFKERGEEIQSLVKESVEQFRTNFPLEGEILENEKEVFSGLKVKSALVKLDTTLKSIELDSFAPIRSPAPPA